MSKIFSGLTMFLSGVVSFSILAGPASAAVTLPHTQHWSTVSPWAQVYSGSALDSTQSAPGSASTSLRFTYWSGMKDGPAPDKVWVTFNSTVTEVWTQYYFKYSSNFYFHSIINKQTYWYISGSVTNWYVGVTGSRKMQMTFQRNGGDGAAGNRYSNTGYDPTIQRDTWYKLVTRAVLNTGGSANGIFQMWINDQLVMNYSNISYLVGSDVGKKCGSMAFDPVFGGMNSEYKPATDYFWVDYTIVSTNPIDSSPPPPADEGKTPQAPSNITID